MSSHIPTPVIYGEPGVEKLIDEMLLDFLKKTGLRVDQVEMKTREEHIEGTTYRQIVWFEEKKEEPA